MLPWLRKTIWLSLALLCASCEPVFAATTAKITISGAEQNASGIWDGGSITVTVNNAAGTAPYSETFPYGQFSSPASVAAGVASRFSLDPSAPVWAQSFGAVISFVARSGVDSVTVQAGSAVYNSTQFSQASFSYTFQGIADATVALSSNANPSVPGTNVIFNAALTPGATGTITFYDGSTQLGVSTISSNNGVLSTSSLSTGLHNIAAFYSGDSQYAPAESSMVFQLVEVHDGPASSTSLYSYAVNYLPNGNVTSYSDSVNGQWSLGYDNLNRLASASPSSGPFAGQISCWAYDSFGNITGHGMQTSTCPSVGSSIPSTWSRPIVQPNNQVTGDNTTGLSYAYDGSGNMQNTQGDIPAGGGSPIQSVVLYDGEGRVCATRQSLTSGLYVQTQYIYDAESNRVAKGSIFNWSYGCDTTQNGFQQTATYIIGPNGEQMTELQQSGGTSSWVHTNVYAAGELAVTYANDNGGQTPLAGNVHFVLSDWLGSKRVQLAADGAVEQSWSNQPFGDNQQCVICGTDATEHHYTGKERDTESGLDYFGARYYGSSMGRFMSPDWAPGISPIPYADISDPQTLNLYSFVRNNPLSRRDADGHHQECAPDTSSTGSDGSVTVTAGACHEVPDPPTMLQNIGNWFSRTGASIAAVISRSLGSFGGPRAGKPMTPRGKQQVIQRNAEANGGKNVCENCGQPTVPAQQSQAGVSRPGNENAVDHIYPMSKGGDGDPATNGGLLCSTCNGIKSDSLPTTGEPIAPVAPIEPIIPIEPIFIEPIIIP